MIPIYPFQTQEVRDLAWACFSPPLMHLAALATQASSISDCTFALTAQRQTWLEALDQDASSLLIHLAQKPSHRLGIYFEQLWQFFLQQDPEVELVASNLPIHDQGRTLGEFDCIYFCQRRQRHVHLELAVKYFLGAHNTVFDESDDTACAWLGPDTRDRLDKKIDHILHRQILLGEHAPAQSRLHGLGIGPLLKEIAFKGQLFQPRNAALPPPRGHNNSLPFSEWLHCDKVEQYLSTLSTPTFEILPKMRWLSAAHTRSSADALSADQLSAELANYFLRDSYPVLIAAMDDRGQESLRFFVTGLGWPHGNPQALAGNTLQ